MTSRRNNFDWMSGACYEPPRPRRYIRSRAWVRPVFFVLTLIAIVTGGLIAWSQTL